MVVSDFAPFGFSVQYKGTGTGFTKQESDDIIPANHGS